MIDPAPESKTCPQFSKPTESVCTSRIFMPRAATLISCYFKSVDNDTSSSNSSASSTAGPPSIVIPHFTSMRVKPARCFDMEIAEFLRSLTERRLRELRLQHAQPVLIQSLIADQPWKVLVAVTFLNVTAGRVSIPVFWRVMDRWSTAEALAEADEDEVFVLIRHLGLGRTRARRIIELSQEYLKHPPDFNTLFPTKSTVSSTPNSPSKRRRAGARSTNEHEDLCVPDTTERESNDASMPSSVETLKVVEVGSPSTRGRRLRKASTLKCEAQELMDFLNRIDVPSLLAPAANLPAKNTSYGFLPSSPSSSPGLYTTSAAPPSTPLAVSCIDNIDDGPPTKRSRRDPSQTPSPTKYAMLPVSPSKRRRAAHLRRTPAAVCHSPLAEDENPVLSVVHENSSSTPRSDSHGPAARRYPPTPVSHLPGLGAYALDSFRIFCTLAHDPTSQEWKLVRPNDKELVRYLKWKWAAEEGKIWSPEFGVVGDVTDDYIDALCTVLEYTAYSPNRTDSSDE